MIHKLINFLSVLCIVVGITSCSVKQQYDEVIKNDLHASSYPLISIHPDICIFSVADTLFQQQLKCSEGERDFPFVGAIRVDGKVYRFMGTDEVLLQTVAPISFEGEWDGKYTFFTPADGWQQTDFDDSQWKTGTAAFGTREQRDTKTLWPTSNIWVRREIKIDSVTGGRDSLFLQYSHDDIFQLYINGKQLVNTGYEWRNDVRIHIPDSITETMKNGKMVIAAHCENRFGGGLVDFGIYAKPKKATFPETTAVQESVDIQATQTHYTFRCGEIRLNLSFTSPVLMDDLALLSRPVNYISYQIISLDDNDHQVEIYFELNPVSALGSDESCFYKESGLLLMKSGYSKQKLWTRNDKTPLSWGYFYLGVEDDNVTSAIGDISDLRKDFLESGCLISNRTSETSHCVAIAKKLGKVKSTSDKLMLGFDGMYTIQYFGENLLPYWDKKGHKRIEQEFCSASKVYEKTLSKCYRFDRQLMIDASQIGGKEYADLCAQAYRPTIAPFQLSESPENELMFFTKTIGPLDFYYHAFPLILKYNPALVKAMLNPFFDYSESGRWVKPYPARDMGEYPLINGQTGAEDLPVDGAGSILIMTAAIAEMEGDTIYAVKHWSALSRWGDFLIKDKTISVKAILGIASYGLLAERLGEQELSRIFMEEARRRSAEWKKRHSENGELKYELEVDQGLYLKLFFGKIYKDMYIQGVKDVSFSYSLTPKTNLKERMVFPMQT